MGGACSRSDGGGLKVKYISDNISETVLETITKATLIFMLSLSRNARPNKSAEFTQAKKLKETGILFCLSYEGDMEAMGARNLPFSAGTAVTYGMDYEDAIAAITLNAAKILGIDAEVGSIEHAKNATFFISSGDALDMRTNNVEQAFISGKAIDLNNHQKELFEKYKDR